MSFAAAQLPTVTAATIRCRHCSATGIVNFVRRTEYLLEGGAADSIICLLCGDRLVSRPVLAKMSRPFDNTVDHIAGRGKSDAYTAAVPCATPGCVRRLKANRTEKGQTLCCYCARNVNRKALSQRLKEINHVETISSLPCLAPPAPPASGTSHPQSRVVDDRRDGDESLADRLLTTIGLFTRAGERRGWSDAELAEAITWATAVEAIPPRSRRPVPAMPDVLCTIYDALQATG